MQDFDETVLEDVVEVKSLSPDAALRRRRPRYKVICSGERPKEVNERLLQLYPFVDQKVCSSALCQVFHMKFALCLKIYLCHEFLSFVKISSDASEWMFLHVYYPSLCHVPA